MSRFSAPCLVVAGFGMVAGVAYLSNPIAQAGPKDDPDLREIREIDLSMIYSTSRQKGLKDVQSGLEPDTPEWKEPYNIGSTLDDAKSPPLLTVVRGENVKEAVLAAARFVKAKPRPAGPVGRDDKSTSKKFWLFVYIGHDSSTPPQWVIYAPSVLGNKVRLSYVRFDSLFWYESKEATADDHSYLYWVPLGDVGDPSELKAELVELSKTVKDSYPAKPKK